MKKIPTLFRRDPEDMKHVLPEVTPGCEWALAGEGVATRKYDGTCVMYDGADWWARREVKPGKMPPSGWFEVDADETMGKRVGWEPIDQSPFVKAFRDCETAGFQPGTYELCGPKINGNPEGFESHALVKHADAETFGASGRPRSFEALRDLVIALGHADGWEGIVFHHPDGRMAKLKARDFPPTTADQEADA